MANILVTGATGMVGQHLIPLLKSNGYNILTLTTNGNIANPSKSIYHWDPAKGVIDTQALHQIDIVIHLAGANVGSKRWTKSYKKEILESRVKGAELLFQSFKKTNNFPKAIISAGGIGYYEDPSSEILTENSNNGKHFLAEVCAAWEKSVLQFSEYDTQTTILRTGPILDSNKGLLPAFSATHFLRIIPTVGNANHIFSWIHIEDLCQMFLHVIAQKLEGIYNAVSPKPCEQIILAKAIAHAYHKFCFFPTVPAFLIRMVLGEKADIALTDQNVSAQKIMNTGFQFKYVDVESAVQSLVHGG